MLLVETVVWKSKIWVEVNALIEMAFSLERLMGKTQDIEWAFDETGGVWILQTRDL